MTKPWVLPLVLALSLGVAAPAEGVIGVPDPVPAATLLYPYFEVDLANPNGVTTLLGLQNTSATAVLAHYVVWTDLGVPVLNFNVYLTGYDVQTINLRDVIALGMLPTTASAGQDPADTISNQGIFSQDINFASCTGQLPLPPLSADVVAGVRAALTGQASTTFGGLCGGTNRGDSIARGYVTVDTVNSCTLVYPGNPGYFGPGGSGVATNQNVLLGDFFLVDPAQNYAQGEGAVSIEASATDPLTSTSGNYTFYGRYVGWTANDNREPLPTIWGATYTDTASELFVWRDPKVSQAPFTCPVTPAARPAWYPLGQTQIVAFDMQENPTALGGTPFAAAAQRVTLGMTGGDLVTPARSGWLFLNLNTSVAAAGAVPPSDPVRAQSWVVSLQLPKAEGRFSTATAAVPLDSDAYRTGSIPLLSKPGAPTASPASKAGRSGK
ncbi:MAG: hypothetical protein RBU36_05085 [Thermoanaerobaculia bacterium]|jgi:hypothetical protein|nr:hypothetical protein [Thermoanaerobaculia bacterium]